MKSQTRFLWNHRETSQVVSDLAGMAKGGHNLKHDAASASKVWAIVEYRP